MTLRRDFEEPVALTGLESGGIGLSLRDESSCRLTQGWERKHMTSFTFIFDRTTAIT